MCLSCEPYRPGFEDTTSTTEVDAARAERERAEWLADDPPDPAENADEIGWRGPLDGGVMYD